MSGVRSFQAMIKATKKILENMREISSQWKSWDDEMRVFLYGIESRKMTRLGFLRKKDAQGKGYVAKRNNMLNYRGNHVRCFLCNENRFAEDFPIKAELE
jgi:hypothetical protein